MWNFSHRRSRKLAVKKQPVKIGGIPIYPYLLHDAGYLGLPESWKPGDEDGGQPPAWFELKQEAEQHRAEVAAQTRQQIAKTAIYTFSRENEDGTRTTVRVRAANQTAAREALSQTFLNRATLCTVQDGERYEL